MKKRLFLIAMSLGLLVAAFALYQIQATRASNWSVVTEEPVVQADADNLLPGEVTSVDDDLAQQIQTLVDQWEEPFVSSSGWLHVVEQHDSNIDSKGTLPDGQPIPAHYIKDAWYLLDEQGLVVKAVTVQKDLNGTPTQTTVFQGNMWYNLTTDEQVESKPFAMRLDFGFSDNASRGHEWYSALERGEVTLENKSVIVFTLRETLKEPEQIASNERTAAGVETRAYFNSESGAFLSMEVVEISTDGKELIVFQAKTLTLEKGEPPVEVLSLLEEVSQ
jgi:hypothetical protein